MPSFHRIMRVSQKAGDCLNGWYANAYLKTSFLNFTL
jgi:hypothetical protein